MRKIIISILLFISYSSDGQLKADYHWFFGYDFRSSDGFQSIQLDFNLTSSNGLSPLNKGLEMHNMSASIADEQGNLLFYTNGCAVANRNHDIMPLGDSINRGGGFFEMEWRPDCTLGYPGRQDIIILPDPGNDQGYYIMHYRADYINSNFDIADIPLYTYVDLSLDGGLGDLTVINQKLDESVEVLSGYLTAIHHANGKDWWVLSPIIDEGAYLRTLIDTRGLHSDTLYIGEPFHPNASASGFSRFSPDGLKYAYYNEDDRLRLYNFNRSTGELSGEQNITVNSNTSEVIFTGLEWSPNSRFIYIADGLQVWQVDTWENDIEANGIRKVATWDGTVNPLPTTFTELALGPDCKIYLRPKNGIYSWHIMYQPDELGEACNIVQNALQFPPERPAGNGSMPNFPRFRVDAAVPCDNTITTVLEPYTYETLALHTYPNPSSDYIHVDLAEEGRLVLTDSDGQVHYDQYHSRECQIQIDVRDFPVGLYHVGLWVEGKKRVYVNGVSVVR